MPHYLTQAEAERAVGGAHELKELLPRAGYATADPDMLEDCLSAVDGEIRRCIGLSFDLDAFDAMYFNQAVGGAPAPSTPMSPADRSATRSFGQKIFAFEAWDRGAKKLAMPATAKGEADKASNGLKEMGKRLFSLGSGRQPGDSRGYRAVTSMGIGEYRKGTPLSKCRGWR